MWDYNKNSKERMFPEPGEPRKEKLFYSFDGHLECLRAAAEQSLKFARDGTCMWHENNVMA
jgi:hypothetical protein